MCDKTHLHIIIHLTLLYLRIRSNQANEYLSTYV